MVAKAAGGVIGLGLIGTGSIAVAKPHWFGIDYMPEWHSLSKDNGYPSSDYSEGKFGKKYGKYLVGVTNETGKEDKNQKFWEWAYRRFNKDGEAKVGKFKSVAEGGDTTSLNKVCEIAYKKNTTDLKPDSGQDIGTDDFKKSDVWKYCSPGLLIHTDKDGNTYKDKIGGEEADKTTLVSVKDSSNDWFWKIRNEDFWATTGDWSGSTSSNGQDSNKSIFKEVYEGGKNDTNKRKPIKDICGDVYKLETTSKGGNNKTDAQKFCKLEANS